MSFCGFIFCFDILVHSVNVCSLFFCENTRYLEECGLEIGMYFIWSALVRLILIHKWWSKLNSKIKKKKLISRIGSSLIMLSNIYIYCLHVLIKTKLFGFKMPKKLKFCYFVLLLNSKHNLSCLPFTPF